MKTTLDIPDAVFRRAKARAAERGQALREFVTEALQEKLSRRHGTLTDPPWMRGFGRLRGLSRETRRIERLLRESFDVIEPEDTQ